MSISLFLNLLITPPQLDHFELLTRGEEGGLGGLKAFGHFCCWGILKKMAKMKFEYRALRRGMGWWCLKGKQGTFRASSIVYIPIPTVNINYIYFIIGTVILRLAATYHLFQSLNFWYRERVECSYKFPVGLERVFVDSMDYLFLLFCCLVFSWFFFNLFIYII